MKTCVYISIANKTIKVVSGSVINNKLSIKRCLTAPILGDEGNPQSLWENRAANLASFWHSNNLPRRDVRLILDNEHVLTKKIDTPILVKKQLLSLIKNEFSGQLTEEFEYLYDYKALTPRLPGKENMGVIIASAIEKKLIENYSNMFKRIGVRLESIDIALNSALHVLNRVGNGKHTFICAVLEGANIELYLFVDGQYSFSHVGSILEQRGTPAAAVEISRNISSMLQFNIAQRFDREVSAVLICGLFQEEMVYCDNMSQSLNIPVSILGDEGKLINKSGQAKQCHCCLSEYIYALGGLFEK